MSRKVRVGALIGLVVVVLIVIGVMVWPTPKKARASTTLYTINDFFLIISKNHFHLGSQYVQY